MSKKLTTNIFMDKIKKKIIGFLVKELQEIIKFIFI
jgi:hypothetical protein